MSHFRTDPSPTFRRVEKVEGGDDRYCSDETDYMCYRIDIDIDNFRTDRPELKFSTSLRLFYSDKKCPEKLSSPFIESSLHVGD